MYGLLVCWQRSAGSSISARPARIQPQRCLRYSAVLTTPAVRLSDGPVMVAVQLVISPDFPLESTGFFPGKHFIHFLVLKMKDILKFVLHDCIFVFDTKQVYLQLQVNNLENKEVTVNFFFEKPSPYILYPIS